MNYKERGKYIEKYLLKIKKDNNHWDYRRCWLIYKLGIKYIKYECDYGENGFVYTEWFRWWNPIIWVVIIVQAPFFLLLGGLSSLPSLVKDIKYLFRVCGRHTILKHRFNSFMQQYYPKQIENFYYEDFEF